MSRSGANKRRAERKRASGVIQVINAITGETMGRIGNLSSSGLMLISQQALRDDALYQLSFQLPYGDGHAHTMEIGVHEQWSEQAAVPGQHWGGFRIIDLSPDDAAALQAWLARPENALI
jgi:hypothetical protein